jgi:acyl-CoA hydrolase
MICKEMYNNSKKEFYDMNIEAKRVTDSMAETVHIVRPNHLNGANRLFGGILMQWIDEVAGIVAKRHAMANVITASVDNLRFIKGAYQNEMVVIVGKLTHVGNTSMEVRVDTYVENKSGRRKAINSAYFVMVALDENDTPVSVPKLIVETEEEKAEWEAAEKRREMRSHRKVEGF